MLPRKLHYLQKALRRQYWPREKLRRYQDQKLRELVRHAYQNVPYYRETWKEAGVEPGDIQGRDDLEKLPTIDKQTILDNYEDFFAENMSRENARTESTSGSSGVPLKVYHDERAWDYMEAVYLRALMALEYRPWEGIAYYWYEPLKERIHEKLGLMEKKVVTYTEPLDRQLEKLESWDLDWLYAFPSHLRILGRELEDPGFEKIVSHGEILTDTVRNEIEELFDAPVYDEYGSTEFNRIAWECMEQDGMHVDIDQVVIELLESGEGLDKAGEMVVTNLHSYLMPLIRYRTGDIARTREGYCDCGRSLPVMDVVEGRSDDMIEVDGEKITPRDFVHRLMKVDGIRKFRVIQDSSGDITAYYQPEEGQNPRDAIRTKIREILGSKDFSVEENHALERNSHGKLKAVESEFDTGWH
ncbi:MAG: phenylacetate--CoA ligase family protein [Candidatus Nanohaloarchaea archaeon]